MSRLNLVLACGYLGFRHIGPIEYFNGVAEYLTDRYPVRIVETYVAPTRGVEYRGDQLRRQILIALGEVEPETREERDIAGSLGDDRAVHVISHSMGSLDSRFLLSPANPNSLAGRVTTLTTVAGPHRGSPTAGLLFKDVEGVGLSKLEKKAVKGFRKLLKLANISLEGLENLTPEWTARFNEKYVDHPDVRYFSVAGGGYDDRTPPTSKVMAWSWEYIHEVTGGEVNDGAVPLSSAKWGEFNPDLWYADHPGLIGHDVDRCGLAPPDFDYKAAYGKLVEQLLELDPAG